MKKIPTCLERDWEGDRSRVLNQITPGCEWVFAGEGVATRKLDGTCMRFDGTSWWARREVREGKEAPPNFVPVTEADPETGKVIGWEPVEQSPFAKFHQEALSFWDDDDGDSWDVGTYELIGPKIQGNPETFEGQRPISHDLVSHTQTEQAPVNRTYEGMKAFLEKRGWEGIVFHHPDGRMAKIKGRDFGLRR